MLFNSLLIVKKIKTISSRPERIAILNTDKGNLSFL
nr:MAG TPA: hypothetical protein [Caudoviricetes sp.]